MSNQAEFERNLAALIAEFKRLGVSNQQIRKALQDHASNNAEMPDALQPEKDYSFRKRIRAVVSPDDKDLAGEVEYAIGAQLDDVGARCGLCRNPSIS
jgi:hypothetical protein